MVKLSIGGGHVLGEENMRCDVKKLSVYTGGDFSLATAISARLSSPGVRKSEGDAT